MRSFALAAALSSLALLGACAEGGNAPSASSAPAAAATAAPAAAGPAGTRFDGRYSGDSMLTLNRGRDCGPLTSPRTLTVTNGQGSFVVDRAQGVVAVGPVQADGTLSLVAPQGRGTTVSGKIEGSQFTGTMRALQCERSLELTKRG